LLSGRVLSSVPFLTVNNIQDLWGLNAYSWSPADPQKAAMTILLDTFLSSI
jgi:hypothetical protein